MHLLGCRGTTARALWLILALAPAPLAANPQSAPDPWLDVEVPRSGERVTGTPWIEIRGRAREPRLHARLDLAIALDVSESSFAPAGFDVDRDGVRGGWRRAGFTTDGLTDRDDSLAAAGLASALALMRSLDPSRTRVAFIAFSDRARVLAPLGSPGQTASLASAFELPTRRAGTNIASAVELAVATLYPRDEPRRPQTDPPVVDTLGARAAVGTPAHEAGHGERHVLLISDGRPTLPGSRAAPQRYALRASIQARQSGIRVSTLMPVRASARVPTETEALVRAGGGTALRSATPESWVRELAPHQPAAIRTVELWNARSEQTGRAVRWFLDGSFDGYLPLLTGSNPVHVRIELADGRRLEHAVRVDYIPTPDRGAHQRLLDRLRTRSREIDLLHAARQRTRLADRSLRRVRVEPENNGEGESDGDPARND